MPLVALPDEFAMQMELDRSKVGGSCSNDRGKIHDKGRERPTIRSGRPTPHDAFVASGSPRATSVLFEHRLNCIGPLSDSSLFHGRRLTSSTWTRPCDDPLRSWASSCCGPHIFYYGVSS